jgi:hypothetical protein
MKPKQPKVAATFLKSLAYPEVREIVDHSKLLRSAIFSDAVTIALKQVNAHRNTAPLEQILNLFADTQFYRPLLYWLCSDRALRFRYRDGRIVLLVSGKQNTSLEVFHTSHLREFLKQKGSLNDVLRKLGETLPNETSARYLDALDSRKRLPGSYGAKTGG